ncbi:MAG: hypothetical protein ABRQ23_07325, partial [Syntrophomonadaceae bacterium]
MHKKLTALFAFAVLLVLAFYTPPVQAVFKEVYSELYKTTDIAYADASPFQKLDIYYPTEGEGP